MTSATPAYGYGATSATTPWCSSLPARAASRSGASTETRSGSHPSASRERCVHQTRATSRRPRRASKTGRRP